MSSTSPPGLATPYPYPDGNQSLIPPPITLLDLSEAGITSSQQQLQIIQQIASYTSAITTSRDPLTDWQQFITALTAHVATVEPTPSFLLAYVELCALIFLHHSYYANSDVLLTVFQQFLTYIDSDATFIEQLDELIETRCQQQCTNMRYFVLYLRTMIAAHDTNRFLHIISWLQRQHKTVVPSTIRHLTTPLAVQPLYVSLLLRAPLKQPIFTSYFTPKAIYQVSPAYLSHLKQEREQQQSSGKHPQDKANDSSIPFAFLSAPFHISTKSPNTYIVASPLMNPRPVPPSDKPNVPFRDLELSPFYARVIQYLYVVRHNEELMFDSWKSQYCVDVCQNDDDDDLCIEDDDMEIEEQRGYSPEEQHVAPQQQHQQQQQQQQQVSSLPAQQSAAQQPSQQFYQDSDSDEESTPGQQAQNRNILSAFTVKLPPPAAAVETTTVETKKPSKKQSKKKRKQQGAPASFLMGDTETTIQIGGNFMHGHDSDDEPNGPSQTALLAQTGDVTRNIMALRRQQREARLAQSQQQIQMIVPEDENTTRVVGEPQANQMASQASSAGFYNDSDDEDDEDEDDDDDDAAQIALANSQANRISTLGFPTSRNTNSQQQTSALNITISQSSGRTTALGRKSIVGSTTSSSQLPHADISQRMATAAPQTNSSSNVAGVGLTQLAQCSTSSHASEPAPPSSHLPTHPSTFHTNNTTISQRPAQPLPSRPSLSVSRRVSMRVAQILPDTSSDDESAVDNNYQSQLPRAGGLAVLTANDDPSARETSAFTSGKTATASPVPSDDDESSSSEDPQERIATLTGLSYHRPNDPPSSQYRHQPQQQQQQQQHHKPSPPQPQIQQPIIPQPLQQPKTVQPSSQLQTVQQPPSSPSPLPINALIPLLIPTANNPFFRLQTILFSLSALFTPSLYAVANETTLTALYGRKTLRSNWSAVQSPMFQSIGLRSSPSIYAIVKPQILLQQQHPSTQYFDWNDIQNWQDQELTFVDENAGDLMMEESLSLVQHTQLQSSLAHNASWLIGTTTTTTSTSESKNAASPGSPDDSFDLNIAQFQFESLSSYQNGLISSLFHSNPNMNNVVSASLRNKDNKSTADSAQTLLPYIGTQQSSSSRRRRENMNKNDGQQVYHFPVYRQILVSHDLSVRRALTIARGFIWAYPTYLAAALIQRVGGALAHYRVGGIFPSFPSSYTATSQPHLPSLLTVLVHTSKSSDTEESDASFSKPSPTNYPSWVIPNHGVTQSHPSPPQSLFSLPSRHASNSNQSNDSASKLSTNNIFDDSGSDNDLFSFGHQDTPTADQSSGQLTELDIKTTELSLRIAQGIGLPIPIELEPWCASFPSSATQIRQSTLPTDAFPTDIEIDAIWTPSANDSLSSTETSANLLFSTPVNTQLANALYQSCCVKADSLHTTTGAKQHRSYDFIDTSTSQDNVSSKQQVSASLLGLYDNSPRSILTLACSTSSRLLDSTESSPQFVAPLFLPFTSHPIWSSHRSSTVITTPNNSQASSSSFAYQSLSKFQPSPDTTASMQSYAKLPACTLFIPQHFPTLPVHSLRSCCQTLDESISSHLISAPTLTSVDFSTGTTPTLYHPSRLLAMKPTSPSSSVQTPPASTTTASSTFVFSPALLIFFASELLKTLLVVHAAGFVFHGISSRDITLHLPSTSPLAPAGTSSRSAPSLRRGRTTNSGSSPTALTLDQHIEASLYHPSPPSANPTSGRTTVRSGAADRPTLSSSIFAVTTFNALSTLYGNLHTTANSPFAHVHTAAFARFQLQLSHRVSDLALWAQTHSICSQLSHNHSLDDLDTSRQSTTSTSTNPPTRLASCSETIFPISAPISTPFTGFITPLLPSPPLVFSSRANTSTAQPQDASQALASYLDMILPAHSPEQSPLSQNDPKTSNTSSSNDAPSPGLGLDTISAEFFALLLSRPDLVSTASSSTTSSLSSIRSRTTTSVTTDSSAQIQQTAVPLTPSHIASVRAKCQHFDPMELTGYSYLFELDIYSILRLLFLLAQVTTETSLSSSSSPNSFSLTSFVSVESNSLPQICEQFSLLENNTSPQQGLAARQIAPFSYNALFQAMLPTANSSRSTSQLPISSHTAAWSLISSVLSTILQTSTCHHPADSSSWSAHFEPFHSRYLNALGQGISKLDAALQTDYSLTSDSTNNVIYNGCDDVADALKIITEMLINIGDEQ